MQRAVKKKSNLYVYLDSTKVLETGDENAIALARKVYWSNYKKNWLKEHRKSNKQILISLTPDEAKQIAEFSKKYKRGRPRFIKECCFAFLDKRYLVPDQVALNSIRQLLALNYNALQKLFDENIVLYQAGMSLMQQMKELEQKVLTELYNPKELNQKDSK